MRLAAAVHHRLRPGRHGRGRRPGGEAISSRRPRVGLEPGADGPARDVCRIRRGRRAVALSDARRASTTKTPRPSRAGRHHRSSGPVPRGQAASRAKRSSSTAAPAASARWSCRWPRPPAPGHRHRRQPTKSAAARQARARTRAVNYKTDDVAAAVKAFAPDGVNVYWETRPRAGLRQDRVATSAERGRIILMAGRDARPAFPGRPVLRQRLLAPRLRHVQSHRRRAAALRRRHQPLARSKASSRPTSAACCRSPKPPPPTSCRKKTRCKKPARWRERLC